MKSCSILLLACVFLVSSTAVAVGVTPANSEAEHLVAITSVETANLIRETKTSSKEEVAGVSFALGEMSALGATSPRAVIRHADAGYGVVAGYHPLIDSGP